MISFVVPAYNEEQLLAGTLEYARMLLQSGSDREHAMELVTSALATAEELGMKAIRERAQHVKAM